MAPEDFWAEEHDVREWDDISVPAPAHIQLHGYDLPQYTNVQYPWDGCEQIDPSQVPTSCNPVVGYARDVELAEARGARSTSPYRALTPPVAYPRWWSAEDPTCTT